MAEVEEEVTPTPEPTLEPEGTDLKPTESSDEIGELRAMIVEMQGQLKNLQEIADKATPVEPAAEEAPEEQAPADDSALLEDGEEEGGEPKEEDLEEIDALLSAN